MNKWSTEANEMNYWVQRKGSIPQIFTSTCWESERTPVGLIQHIQSRAKLSKKKQNSWVLCTAFQHTFLNCPPLPHPILSSCSFSSAFFMLCHLFQLKRREKGRLVVLLLSNSSAWFLPLTLPDSLEATTKHSRLNSCSTCMRSLLLNFPGCKTPLRKKSGKSFRNSFGFLLVLCVCLALERYSEKEKVCSLFCFFPPVYYIHLFLLLHVIRDGTDFALIKLSCQIYFVQL